MSKHISIPKDQHMLKSDGCKKYTIHKIRSLQKEPKNKGAFNIV